MSPIESHPMPFPAASNLSARMRRLARRWSDDTEGVAAIEFAFIVPIMAFMFIGAVELSQAITVDRRVTQVASSTADLVARWQKPSDTSAPNGIAQSEITDIMRVGGYIVAPYDQNPLQVIIRSVVSSPSNASVAKQWWSCTYNGLGNTLTCACSDSSYTLPAGLVTTGDSVIISETTYSYKPLVFDYFMKSMGSTGGTYALAETIYLKPRNSLVNLVQTNNALCPALTF
jgi:Flp pilus assembly protein TadG